MAAQTADAERRWRNGDLVEGVPLQAAAKVYQGSVVEIDGSGDVKPGAKAANKTYFGVAVTGGDNTAGAAGAVTIKVRRKATVLLAKTGTAVRGKAAYLADDQTVTDVATGASKVGRIVDVDRRRRLRRHVRGRRLRERQVR